VRNKFGGALVHLSGWCTCSGSRVISTALTHLSKSDPTLPTIFKMHSASSKRLVHWNIEIQCRMIRQPLFAPISRVSVSVREWPPEGEAKFCRTVLKQSKVSLQR
jgi:hypothetical protein